MDARPHPLQPGEPAPDLTLPAINREGMVTLANFRGRAAVLIGLFRGLHCPFCRRQIAQLAGVQAELKAGGTETLAIINTPLERGRIYYRNQPTPVILVSDEHCAAHHAFGVPRVGFRAPDSDAPPAWPGNIPFEQFEAARINPGGLMPEASSPLASNAALNRQDGFELAPADQTIFETHGTQLTGYFLVDRAGIVRWSWTEAASGPEEIGKYPSPAEMVATARTLA